MPVPPQSGSQFIGLGKERLRNVLDRFVLVVDNNRYHGPGKVLGSTTGDAFALPFA